MSQVCQTKGIVITVDLLLLFAIVYSQQIHLASSMI